MPPKTRRQVNNPQLIVIPQNQIGSEENAITNGMNTNIYSANTFQQQQNNDSKSSQKTEDVIPSNTIQTNKTNDEQIYQNVQNKDSIKLITQQHCLTLLKYEKKDFLELLTNVEISFVSFDEVQQETLLKCKNLKKLTLEHNYSPFSKQIFDRISNVIPNLKLQEIELKFRNSKINQTFLSTLFEKICQARSILKLQFNLGISIGPTSLRTLSNCISQLIQLKQFEINITNESIQSCHIIQFAQGISQCINLTCLKLSFFCINFSDPKTLMSTLSKCESLICLHISLVNNKIKQLQAIQLGQEIQQLTNLQQLELNLNENQIEDEGCAAIFLGLSRLNNLKGINLAIRDNNISNGGIIQSCQNLKKYFYNLIIDPTGIIALFQALNVNQHLEKIKLLIGNADPRLSRVKLELIKEHLNHLPNLYHLDLNLAEDGSSDNKTALEFINRLKSFNNLRYLALCIRGMQQQGRVLNLYNQMIIKIPNLVNNQLFFGL